MTTEFCVVGSPIQHSLSPVIHSAAYSQLGLDFGYSRQEVVQGGLSTFLSENQFSAASVTMPLKHEAFDLASSVDDQAARTGVANTLVREAGGWFGYNTDVSGFMRCFKQLDGVKAITILGSGATARSACLAISKVFPASEVFVVGRNAQAVESTISLLIGLGIKASPPKDSLASVINSDLVVSTVPGTAFSELWRQVATDTNAPKGTLFDVAYNPWPSNASRSWRARSISGMELLIWQAIEQVKIFAKSHGHSALVADEELYQVMLSAIQKQTDLK
jgi:shikimate dehydrogenase